MTPINKDKARHSEKPDILYPCVWQYKVIGQNQTAIKQAIKDITAPAPVTITCSHSSSKGKYHSINAAIKVHDEKARLSIYRALHKHPDIKVVL